ncbi:hypothetical protein [uncultured Sphingomonas sp.]|uniref:hypothetical protein n=1 Tax=uncultured Sphingomonas sp. TaxID=158754 RepID=UPI0025D32F8D|nr:hypothetical protein [uncultured Sphingomonas sp.]
MSPIVKSALKSAIASAAFRKVLITALIAGGTAVGVSLDPHLADALGNLVIIIASAL